MIHKNKDLTIEQVCDIYLTTLYKLELKKKDPKFLNAILDERGIYYDQEIIDSVVSKLLEKGLLNQIHGTSLYGFGARESFKSKKLKINLNSEFAKEFIENLVGSVNLYQLSNKGKNFIANKQVIDKEGRKIRRENTRKRLMLIIKFISGICAALITAWLISKII